MWIDAAYLKVREAGRIVSVAAIIAVGANTAGRRGVLGMQAGASEAEQFWTELLCSLTRRGLRGVKLVISDAREGLNAPRAQGDLGQLAALPRAPHAQCARARAGRGTPCCLCPGRDDLSPDN